MSLSELPENWGVYDRDSYEESMRQCGVHPGMPPTCLVCDRVFIGKQQFGAKLVKFIDSRAAFMFCRECLQEAIDEFE